MPVNRPLILLIAGALPPWVPAMAQDAGANPAPERPSGVRRV